MKKQILASACLGGLLLGGVQTVFAYERISDTSIETEVTTEVILDAVPEPPGPGPVDPVEPPVVLPPDVLYGINYASNLAFGSVEFSELDQTLTTEFDADLKGEMVDSGEEDGNGDPIMVPGDIFSYVSIRDFRSDVDRDNWELTVERDTSSFIRGGILTLKPAFSSDGSTGTALASSFTIPSSVIVGDAPSKVVTTTDPITGHAAFVLGEASLEIPAYTVGGEYSTKLSWNLIAAP
ncbi:WxL domain-containing protein [Carnobacterium maltaromaticum]|uniref:WxL domain-containing protein n=1 Tax=Carnobacterium maltaromaticum TaxID=2751 RepID=UPI0012FABD3D|nr:WxL domain-containing protein [Carnobacterium maltaromaticum]